MKAGQCKHYTGCLNPRTPTCEAGVNYREHVGGDGFGWVRRLPCTKLLGEDDPTAIVKCDKYREPTAEEISADEARVAAAMKKFMVAFTGNVAAWRKAQGWSKQNKVSATGTVPCESCGTGTIHLSMAAYNGHVWGKCTTDGCVSWVE